LRLNLSAIRFVPVCPSQVIITLENVESRFLGAPYRKVLILQACGAILAAASGLLFSGLVAAVSALVGAGAVVLGNLAYAFIARPSRVNARPASAVLLVHVLAQSAKLFLVLSVMLVAFASGKAAAGWLIAGAGVALLAHWLSLLFYR